MEKNIDCHHNLKTKHFGRKHENRKTYDSWLKIKDYTDTGKDYKDISKVTGKVTYIIKRNLINRWSSVLGFMLYDSGVVAEVASDRIHKFAGAEVSSVDFGETKDFGKGPSLSGKDE